MKLIELIFVFILILSVSNGFVSHKGCKLRVSKDLSHTPPLFIEPNTKEFVRGSDTRGNILFHVGQKMLLACPGKSNTLQLNNDHKNQEVMASCVNGTTFEINGHMYEMDKVHCNEWPVSMQKIVGKCLNNHTLVHIGFDISTGFAKVIELCHDVKMVNTLYSKIIMKPDAASSQKGVARLDWSKGNLFKNLNVDRLYKRTQEQITISKLLGSDELGKKYISLKNDFFLAKGHLVAKSDLFYGTQQSATFWYSNAAPQWQTFNGKNWNSIENDVRNFIGEYNRDLDVYTGTFGVSSLPDSNGHRINLSLDGNGQIPVPKFYWKMLYDPIAKSGIVFVGFNNPYQPINELKEFILCKSICDEVKWLTWERESINKGYSYCCSVDEFVEKVSTAPKLNVISILK